MHTMYYVNRLTQGPRYFLLKVVAPEMKRNYFRGHARAPCVSNSRPIVQVAGMLHQQHSDPAFIGAAWRQKFGDILVTPGPSACPHLPSSCAPSLSATLGHFVSLRFIIHSRNTTDGMHFHQNVFLLYISFTMGLYPSCKRTSGVHRQVNTVSEGTEYSFMQP